ncbi:hypothetical protein OAF63_04415 [Saprospiraceae bacterium]|jgi:hypothetical protein|nr:hypothetical protein [Bacteroidota bacterium]MDB4728015.1 hypothetical protein [Saprospiraceae bacterium]MDF1868225.1 hypothetical protein [Saprospiraceae bacterium]
MKKKNKIQGSVILALLFLSSITYGQMDFSFEFQAYPTGLIPGLRIEKAFKENYAFHLRLGYNWIRHQDFGEHEDERGDGYGFTLGYKRYFKEGHKGFFIGARNDFWFNELDWKDNIGTPGERSGTSKITVVQPTLETGYAFMKNNLIFTPTVAFGFEFNVKTEGEPTGEGAVLLLGINVGYRIQ